MGSLEVVKAVFGGTLKGDRRKLAGTEAQGFLEGTKGP